MTKMMMTIYSIADLHLSAGDKPMDVFGAHWKNHFERISEDWRARVLKDDVVLLPGDLSWAMHLSEAKEHLSLIGALPGRKLIVKGNHDYWWNAIGRVREALPPDMFAIQNDALCLSGALFCGTRGWTLPTQDSPAEDVRIYERELLRLRMSLEAARNISDAMPLYCMMHYPPLTENQRETGFTRLLREYGVSHLVYGHLHGGALRNAVSGTIDGVCYHQVSCDGLDFQMLRIE